MSEHALDNAQTGFTPSAEPPPPPAVAPTAITVDGGPPRLGPSTQHGAPSTAPSQHSLEHPRHGSSTPIVAGPSDSNPMAPSAARPSLPATTAQPPSLPLVSPVLSAPNAQMTATPSLPGHATPPTQPDAGSLSAPNAQMTATPSLPGHATPPTQPDAGPTLPTGAPSLPAPQATPPTHTETSLSSTSSESAHPMAHLMPAKESGPTEASRRAAEQRSIRKAKAKKNKIRALIVVVILTAAGGPPLARWVVNAINEAGNTATVEEPAE